MLASLTLEPEGRPERQFYFRAKTSDEGVITQVFRQQQYGFHRWRRAGEILKFISHRHQEGRRPLVVDAGANIGASVVYFDQKLPAAKIVAIEPAIANFDILKLNTQGLDVDLRLAALGAARGHVKIIDPGLSHWGYRTEQSEPDSTTVPIVSVNEIYDGYGEEFFPLLVKIDIEGGERSLFDQNVEWVCKTPIIVIEPHDWMLPKQNTVRGLLRLLANEDRDILVQGENIIAIANSLS
jgi:FkbM family methyltransferase